jgi:predicted phage terminase large subunit-like protein
VNAIPKIALRLKEWEARELEIESNMGGETYKMALEAELKLIGWMCKITLKHQNSNKHGRITAASETILNKFHFLDSAHRTAEYAAFVAEIERYDVDGKAKSDDAPDCTSRIAERFLEKMERKAATVSIGKRWF